ncbi:hypothetical protein FIBSPDRAFT_903690 [Athelia psychrophila]|uniref:Secreted protein n=1 Tax=Athelia psychrophila TaxID=1759441 RepID=A0A167VP69_9AGAM|nr:hypothetical protein FIBSPDRAFT_903690 [Fibularhizoctonia sp. CBS 109695]
MPKFCACGARINCLLLVLLVGADSHYHIKIFRVTRPVLGLHIDCASVLRDNRLHCVKRPGGPAWLHSLNHSIGIVVHPDLVYINGYDDFTPDSAAGNIIDKSGRSRLGFLGVGHVPELRGVAAAGMPRVAPSGFGHCLQNHVGHLIDSIGHGGRVLDDILSTVVQVALEAI